MVRKLIVSAGIVLGASAGVVVPGVASAAPATTAKYVPVKMYDYEKSCLADQALRNLGRKTPERSVCRPSGSKWILWVDM
ncbi:hypothetical protein [Amycolatopsis jejuensis]|uniref:hypothetical protein n=1 Tax=Amycolatopsis jejuensis TaxID=330084 RepID=UPI000527D4B0|nr:hypothetical protein [Amycolatopsis jejuensis]